MNIIDAFLGRAPSIDEAEEELGRPDTIEMLDLKVHVERCAKRWIMSYRASKHNSTQLTQIRIILLMMILYGVLTSPHWEKIATFLQSF